MEQILKGYQVVETCKTCKAVGPDGKDLRDFIDKKKKEGMSTPKLIPLLAQMGVHLSQPNVDRHFRNHSPWTREKHIERIVQSGKMIAKQREEHRNAEEELQTLVDMGGDRVESGEIVVDKDLYMFAIDRTMKEGTPLSIKNLVMNFGDALMEKHAKVKIIEGEEVDATTSKP